MVRDEGGQFIGAPARADAAGRRATMAEAEGAQTPLAVARDACFGFLSLEYLTDVRHMLSAGFSAREVLALRLVWPIPLADFMARNNFRLRGNIPGHPPAQWAGCSLAEWMWNSAVDCFLRTHWSTVAIVGG